MSRKRKTVTLTPDAYGYDEDDVQSRGSVARTAGIFGVRVTHDDPQPFHLTVREIDVDDDDVETPGATLFHVASPRSGYYYQPRRESDAPSVDHTQVAGVANNSTSEENATTYIASRDIRVEITGATASGDDIVVNVDIETAGDYRF